MVFRVFWVSSKFFIIVISSWWVNIETAKKYLNRPCLNRADETNSFASDLQKGRVLAAEHSPIRNLNIFTGVTRRTSAAVVINQLLSIYVLLVGGILFVVFSFSNAHSPSRNYNANRKGSELFLNSILRLNVIKKVITQKAHFIIYYGIAGGLLVSCDDFRWFSISKTFLWEFLSVSHVMSRLTCFKRKYIETEIKDFLFTFYDNPLFFELRMINDFLLTLVMGCLFNVTKSRKPQLFLVPNIMLE